MKESLQWRKIRHTSEVGLLADLADLFDFSTGQSGQLVDGCWNKVLSTSDTA